MIILLCMLSFALAEPPVGDSYLEAAQLSYDQFSHHQYLPPDLTIPSARTSKSVNVLSNQYLPPSTRSISQEYGPPNARGRLSPEYGLPTSGTSALRSEISQEQPSLGYSNGYSSILQNPHFLSTRNPSQSYGASARSSQYGTPLARDSASKLGGSATASNPNTNAFALSYPSARSPSLEYGTPSSRATMPSQEYGVPGSSLGEQGYEYTRNALEVLNQKPANYEFAYKVSDDNTGSDFGHMENRQLDRAEGTYFVLLPDGTKQVVEYEADEDGFKPRISVELADPETLLRAGGPY